jgi:hypothetical protein
MNLKTIQIGMYRILRKLGVPRHEIDAEADIENDYFFDDTEKKMLLNFVEFRYSIELTKADEDKIQQVKHITDIIESKNL